MNNQANPELSNKPLDYPFGERWSPELGKPFKVAEDVYWLRMSLPIDLDHINLWLLKDSDGSWTIVDTGYDAQSCKDVWDTVFSNFCNPIDVKQIIITHFHPDHIGLAAWLAKKLNVPILISRGEFEHYQKTVNVEVDVFQKPALRYAMKAGFTESVSNSLRYFFSSSDKVDKDRVSFDMCDFIQESDTLNINGRDWSVVSGSGHSPEHSCLYCKELNVLIAGDQAIARISSNVGVYPTTSSANPLLDWLESCAKLRDTLPEETLILPAHQEPFIGIKRRMQALIDDHMADLARLEQGLSLRKTAVDARKLIFDRELNKIQTVLAVGETLAHLYYLRECERIKEEIENGIAYYQSAD